MNKFLSAFPVLCFLMMFSHGVTAQEKPKNQIGLSFDFIHSWSKSYNFQQNARGSTYDLSKGITLDYERVFKEKYFVRLKLGYYYIENNINFPGEFPIIDHSMKRVGQLNLDAVPIGLNVGIIHHFSSRWTISFHLGLNSYLLYRPIPDSYTEDLNIFLRTMEDVQITTRIISATDLMTTNFIHSYEIGNTISYSPSRTYPLSLYINNHLRVGFRPYMNYEMVVFTSGLQGDEALWNAATSILSTLFFTSIGVRYGF